MFEFINENNLEFAYSNPVWVDKDLKYIKYINKELFYTLDNLFYGNFVGGLIFGHSHIIKSIIPFPEGLTFEDWYVALTLADKFGQCYVHDEKNYLYRRHENASTFHSSPLDKKRLIKRDIDFFQLLIDKKFYPEILTRRMIYYRSMIEKVKFLKFLKVLFSKYLTLRERIKLIVIKVIRYYNV
jgi:hypothetical protein